VNDPIVARQIAADVVGRVLRSGAFSNVLAEMASSGLAARDRARVKALVFGILRRLEVIDEAIETGAARTVDELDVSVLDRLRVSVFEILYGELPAPVAVSAGVDLVRGNKPKAAGLANAVLRRVSRMDRPLPGGLVLPGWLEKGLKAEWGAEQTRSFALASANEPDRIIRVKAGNVEWFAGIVGAVAAEPGALPEGMVVQDASSIAVGNAVGAGPGMSVLDMAAAPGGKTLHLLDQVGGDGLVVAMDRHRRRVTDGARRASAARWLVGDGTMPPFPGRTFDRVLLDAPCSGLGALRRRPEIRLRVDQGDVEALAALQHRLLEAAFRLLAPGGRLVYSVCTVTPEETVDVARDFDLRPADLPGLVWGSGRLLAPHLTSTDGMFVAVHQG
jgi:16S rRNA (cytosine967-C5)-methyltransferase